VAAFGYFTDKLKGGFGVNLPYVIIQGDKPMNEPARQGDRRMTTAEVCVVLKCDRTTLMRNWREIGTCAGAAQVKIFENGKPTCWTDAEVTLLLEKMKGNTNTSKRATQRRCRPSGAWKTS
jgi:predicted DNA-binding WGR domain protein